MFELPEFVTLARQMNECLSGKTIQDGSLGNTPHKFVWYNRSADEFRKLIRGKIIRQTKTRGKWLFVALDPGYTLVFGECGGKIRFHEKGDPLPAKYHLHLAFSDGTMLSATTQMWGAMELYPAGEEMARQYIKGMRATPVDTDFTLAYFTTLVKEAGQETKRSVKSLLTQEQLIPGLGNGLAQDILYQSHLHPKHPIDSLDSRQIKVLYDAIQDIVSRAIELGGRSEEFDFFNQPGKYRRVMTSKQAGQPCPQCGTTIARLQYLGGACYYCPNCQT